MALEKFVRIEEDAPTAEQIESAFIRQQGLSGCGFATENLPAAYVTVGRRMVLLGGRIPPIPLRAHTYNISQEDSFDIQDRSEYS